MVKHQNRRVNFNISLQIDRIYFVKTSNTLILREDTYKKFTWFLLHYMKDFNKNQSTFQELQDVFGLSEAILTVQLQRLQRMGLVRINDNGLKIHLTDRGIEAVERSMDSLFYETEEDLYMYFCPIPLRYIPDTMVSCDLRDRENIPHNEINFRKWGLDKSKCKHIGIPFEILDLSRSKDDYYTVKESIRVDIYPERFEPETGWDIKLHSKYWHGRTLDLHPEHFQMKDIQASLNDPNWIDNLRVILENKFSTRVDIYENPDYGLIFYLYLPGNLREFRRTFNQLQQLRNISHILNTLHRPQRVSIEVARFGKLNSLINYPYRTHLYLQLCLVPMDELASKYLFFLPIMQILKESLYGPDDLPILLRDEHTRFNESLDKLLDLYPFEKKIPTLHETPSIDEFSEFLWEIHEYPLAYELNYQGDFSF